MNPRPEAYESPALPLSYSATRTKFYLVGHRPVKMNDHRPTAVQLQRLSAPSDRKPCDFPPATYLANRRMKTMAATTAIAASMAPKTMMSVLADSRSVHPVLSHVVKHGAPVDSIS